MLILQAIFAGIAISIAGTGFLPIGGLPGAIIFAWGLITVIQLKLKLFTGFAGFFNGPTEFIDLIKIFIANIVGCMLCGILFAGAPGISQAAAAILNTRILNGPINNLLLSIGCGIIMSIAVYGARQDNYLPLLFGIPLFIICGFPHCIADAFYMAIADYSLVSSIPFVIVNWLASIVGNFIGCNLPRLFRLM